jgi:hypothetical protein
VRGKFQFTPPTTITPTTVKASECFVGFFHHVSRCAFSHFTSQIQNRLIHTKSEINKNHFLITSLHKIQNIRRREKKIIKSVLHNQPKFIRETSNVCLNSNRKKGKVFFEFQIAKQKQQQNC